MVLHLLRRWTVSRASEIAWSERYIFYTCQDAVMRRATSPEERGPTEAWPRRKAGTD